MASTDMELARSNEANELARFIKTEWPHELVDDRLPAKALRQLAFAEAEERAAPAALYGLFDRYNKAFFQGKLQQAYILITDCPLRAYGDYIPADVNGLRSRIRLQPKVWEIGDIDKDREYRGRLAADILLHETVHAWAYEIENDREAGYRGHGPKFARKCNEIGQLLGLAPVSPKGRHGFPDCAQWPLNVRPVGYYGNLLDPKEPKKKAKKDDSNSRTEREKNSEQTLATRLIECLAKIDGVSAGEYLENLLRREAVARAREVRECDPELADFLGV